MADAGYFRGTSAEQDGRFSDKDKKLLKTLKFDPLFENKVDKAKVKVDTLKPWISKRVTQLAGFEDDVLIEYVFNQLEQPKLDAKQLQIYLTGFMQKNAKIFVKELWELLLSAQSNPSGIPEQILKEKKDELSNEQAERERLQAGLRKQVAPSRPLLPHEVAAQGGDREPRPRSRSPRRRSRSPPRRRSRTPPRRRSRSPARRRSRSPRRRSRSPPRRRSRTPPRRRSRSPARRRSRSPRRDRSPPRRDRSPRRRSRSPPRRRSSPRRSPVRRRRSPTRSPSASSRSSSSSSSSSSNASPKRSSPKRSSPKRSSPKRSSSKRDSPKRDSARKGRRDSSSSSSSSSASEGKRAAGNGADGAALEAELREKALAAVRAQQD